MGQEKAVRQEFAMEGIDLKLLSGSRYLEAYLGQKEELEAWVKTQVTAWAHRVRVIGKYPNGTPSRLSPV